MKSPASIIIPYGLVIGLSAALLWHFAGIWQYGQFYIAEPRLIVLIGETVIIVTALAIGIIGFIRELLK